MIMGIVPYTNQPQQQEPLTLTEFIPKTMSILELPHHPAVQHVSLEEIKEKQVELLQQRIVHLCNGVERYLFEIGCLMIEGGKLGLYKLTGYESMYSWLRNGMNIAKDLLVLASDRYKAWLHIRPYGFSPEVVRDLDSIKVQRLADINRDVNRQVKIIADRLHETNPRLDQTALLQKAENEFCAQMHAEIEHILLMSPEDLLEERATHSGESIRPDFLVSNISYNPQTRKFAAEITSFLELGHLQAMLSAQHRLRFQRDGETLGEPDFARILLEQLEEQLEEEL